MPDRGISIQGGPSLRSGLTPGGNGLRSGPLSPALLSGPGEIDDYFGGRQHSRGCFPSPNESSLRTGLTPPGGGSMFPKPSANCEVIFEALETEVQFLQPWTLTVPL